MQSNGEKIEFYVLSFCRFFPPNAALHRNRSHAFTLWHVAGLFRLVFKSSV